MAMYSKEVIVKQGDCSASWRALTRTNLSPAQASGKFLGDEGTKNYSGKLCISDMFK